MYVVESSEKRGCAKDKGAIGSDRMLNKFIMRSEEIFTKIFKKLD